MKIGSMVIVSDREISIKERATSEVEIISHESFKSRQQMCNFHINKIKRIFANS